MSDAGRKLRLFERRLRALADELGLNVTAIAADPETKLSNRVMHAKCDLTSAAGQTDFICLMLCAAWSAEREIEALKRILDADWLATAQALIKNGGAFDETPGADMLDLALRTPSGSS